MNKGGLYFHIPFCLRKCAYCDFCSFTGKTEGDMRAYANALIREMRHCADRARDTAFDTVFFGGGTPSLMPTDVIENILFWAKQLFCVEKNAEITLEANPATADEKKLSALREVGINRLSVGVQSLSDIELGLLGRLHTASDSLSFLRSARRVGFDNINVDLMYGIPAQTVASAKETLSAVLDFAPAHISAYSLMFEQGTPLYEKREVLPIPSEEEENVIDLLVKNTLAEHGYLHYEISNFAKKGSESRHNLHYWHSDPYLGFGVAACSFFDGVRYANTDALDLYLSNPCVPSKENVLVTEEELAYEWIMLRLRLKEGLSLSEYRTRFGVDLKKEYANAIKDFTAYGLMEETGDRICLTEKGFRLSNSILVAFMPDEKNS